MPQKNRTNPTAAAVIARLPNKPMLAPRDIADALGLATTQAVINAIEDGRLAAVPIGRRYIIARAETVRWIEESAT